MENKDIVSKMFGAVSDYGTYRKLITIVTKPLLNNYQQICSFLSSNYV